MINIREATVVGLSIVMLFAIGTVFECFYTVDQGERAVLLRNGAVVGVEQPGLHFKLPWIEVVHQVDVQTRTQRHDKVNSYSQDQQSADIAVSVTYRVNPGAVAILYSRFGSVEARLLTPHVFQARSSRSCSAATARCGPSRSGRS